MTTNISVDAHPFKSDKGEQLEVAIETWDNGVLVRTETLDAGQVASHIVCYHGREIRITERVKPT